MSLIQTVDPDRAEGRAREIYDILEALSHGASILMKAFKMDQAC